VIFLSSAQSFAIARQDHKDTKESLPSFTGVVVFLPISDHDDNAGVEVSLSNVSQDTIKAQAEAAYLMLGNFLDTELEFIRMRNNPQQAYGADCGVQVYMTIEHLLVPRLLRRAPGAEQVEMTIRRKHAHGAASRAAILQIVDKLLANNNQADDESGCRGPRVSDSRLTYGT